MTNPNVEPQNPEAVVPHSPQHEQIWLSHAIEQPEPQTDPVPSPESSMVALLRRLHGAELDRNSETIGGHLTEVFEVGDRSSFEAELRQYAIGFLRETDPEFISNIQILHNRNTPLAKQEETARQQRAKLEAMKSLIVETLGLPTEARLTEMQQASEKIRQKISEMVRKGEITEPEDVLRKLGILTNSYASHDFESTEIKVEPDTSREHFTYPYGLFPVSVDDKWKTYLGSVVRHLKTSNKLQTGEASQADLSDADTVREKAHNAVTKDVHQILGLDKLGPNNSWTLENTRNMIAKMRDARFPTIETAEAETTARALAATSISLTVLEKLGHHRHGK